MGVTYTTVVIGEGNHASLEIPDAILQELGTTKRAPLIITINDPTYRSTAVGVAGQCRVVFPQKERAAAGASAGDTVSVHLELDSGRREVDVPAELASALTQFGLTDAFEALTYSARKEHARKVSEAKADETRQRRINAVLESLTSR